MTEDLRVKKIGVTIPISCCLAVEYGVLPVCEHSAVRVPPTRRQRLRRWLAHRWDRRPRIHLGPCNHEECT